MNAKRMLTNKWVLVLGAAALITAAANVSLADPPRRVGMSDGPAGMVDRDRGDGFRGDGFRGGMGEARGGFIDRDRGRDEGRGGFVGRGRDDDRGRTAGPAWQGDFRPGRGPVYVQPTYRPPVVCGGVGQAGPRVIYGTPATAGISIGPITIIIR